MNAAELRALSGVLAILADLPDDGQRAVADAVASLCPPEEGDLEEEEEEEDGAGEEDSPKGRVLAALEAAGGSHVEAKPIAVELGVSTSTVTKWLRILVKEGKVTRTGSRRGTRWSCA